MKNLIRRILLEESTKSNYPSVEEYLKMLAQSTNLGSRGYYQMLLDNLKEVNVGNYRDSKVLSKHIDDLRDKNHMVDRFCQKKGCFDTAVIVATRIPDLNIHYVEGYVQYFIPIVHAWNYFPEENLYFDLINDIAWEGGSQFEKYYQIFNMNRQELVKNMSITGHRGGFIEDPMFLRDYIKKNGTN